MGRRITSEGEARGKTQPQEGGDGLGGDDFYIRHPRMPLSERAKIFVPFNPLRGFQEALREKELEVEREALDEWGGNDLEAPSSRGAHGDIPGPPPVERGPGGMSEEPGA